MFKHIIYYDGSIPGSELIAMYENLENQYGRGTFLFLPNECTYRKFDLKHMKVLRDNMSKLIEEEEQRRANQETSQQ